MSDLVLSLFPGIGMLDRAFEEHEFCVVRGPDMLWGGDVCAFHPPADRFDGVIGGPPCQTFSALAHLVRANGYEPKFGNLIPEFERVIAEAQPRWFLMENVRGAPIPAVAGYAVHAFLWNNCWLGEEQMRERRFSFGVRGEKPVDLRRWMQQAALELPEFRQAVLSDTRTVPVRIGGSGKIKPTCKQPAVTGVHSDPPSKRNGVTSNCGGRNRRMRLGEGIRLQGLPEDFLEHAPFTVAGKLKAIANGVPLPLGRSVANAVRQWLQVSPDSVPGLPAAQ